MKYPFARAALAAVVALAAACGDVSQSSTSPATSPALTRSASQASDSRQGFGFNGSVSGFPTGSVFLTGGGSFDIARRLSLHGRGSAGSAERLRRR
jgi:hypothetical protein